MTPKLDVTIRGDPKLSLGSDAVRVGGVADYPSLVGKPSIEGVTLVGDRSFEELGLVELDNAEILGVFNTVMGGN